MDSLDPQLAMYLIGSAFLGLILGWFLHGMKTRLRIETMSDDWQTKLDNFVRQRDHLTSEAGSLRTTIESLQNALRKNERAVAQAQTELASSREKEKQLSKDVFTLRSEREEFKSKVGEFQNAIATMKYQSAELQEEFIKSREFYKGELIKALERRKALEEKLENARAEHESFTNLLQSSRSEKESVNKMLAAAQTRLDNLDRIEQKVIELEAENAQLNHDASLAQQQIEVLQRDVEELDELKIQNKELAQCVTSLEESRKQYEHDAKRYKKVAGQSEQKSETLRLKLDEVEKTFADMEQQQRSALKEARKPKAIPKTNGKKPPQQVKDNLQEIVGIGKVFEQTLHELGIYSFAQIAAFDVKDVARINMALKECKGRMEQDDWIGQAKELQFKKYGTG
jgi:predicted flap endonuclease-1-like 5' DNA nuclease